jgi:mRNA-degrading endonuclease RelE of RelBE toxin-antitoxin system
MKFTVVWADPVRDLVFDLSPKEQQLIFEKIDLLVRFPQMYPLRQKGKRFRRHRWFLAGDWLVYYRFVSGVVYIRGLWPAQIP